MKQQTLSRLTRGGWAGSRPLSDLSLPLLIAGYLVLVLPLLIPNAGGSGLNLPQNLLSWCVMTLGIILALLKIPRTGGVLMGRCMLVALAGVALLSLPWLWTPCLQWRVNALPRLAGIAGALLFLLALSQQKLSTSVKRFIFIAVVLSSIEQALIAMAEAWAPDFILRLTEFLPRSVSGVFQQSNLLGSWLAAGTGLTLWLALTARTRRRTLCWVLMIYPQITGLILSQSRTGLIGTVCMFLIALVVDFPNWRRRPLNVLGRALFLITVLVWGFGISHWVMPSGKPANFTHSSSTEQRARVIRGTLTLISHHPLAGSGLGSFEALFPQALAEADLQSLENDTFTHPHNEILYVTAEGGIAALSGLLVLGGLWIWPALRLSRRKPVTNRADLMLSLSGLPLVIHMMTEYPLYLSAPHLMLLLLLYRCALPESALSLRRINSPAQIIVLPVALAGCTLLMAILISGLQLQSALTQAEDEISDNFIQELPQQGWRTLTQSERLEYDQYIESTFLPSFWHNEQAMEAFTLWGNCELAIHNNAEISAAMIAIARYRGDRNTVRTLSENAARVFINDPRFKQDGL